VKDLAKKHEEIVRRPERLIYRSCYAAADLRGLLESAVTRSRIRTLPAAQLYFSIKELDDEEIASLLPHITEEQWTAVLDLDLWRKDRFSPDAFLGWERHLIGAEDAVARKLFRAADPEILELVFRRELRILARTEDDEFEADPGDRETLLTPDGNFLIALPRNPEKARLYRLLLLKLYALDGATAGMLLAESRARTMSELEEEAYQARRDRIESLGFQDYYDAIGIYTPLEPGDRLPEKPRAGSAEIGLLPVSSSAFEGRGPMLLFQALAGMDVSETERLVEELFLVCNRLLSADQVSPASPERVRKEIRKALAGINLGLCVWSRGSIPHAVTGLRQHYMLSFFQIGFGQLDRLRNAAQSLVGVRNPDPGGFLEAALEGFLRRYPVLTELRKGRVRRRFIEQPQDLEWSHRLLDRIRRGESEVES
jgi:hypothetical protein